MIPCTHNHAGFPGGISGKELIGRMKEQAQLYGARIINDYVTRLDSNEHGFEAKWGSGSATAKTVLLATGVTNRRPPMDEDLHDEALARGLIRYCPICDGYEVTDKKVGVIGSDSHGVAEAVFLRSYTADVTLIAPHAALKLAPEDRDKLKIARIDCVDGPAQAVAALDKCIVVDTARRALGPDTHTRLADVLGARLNERVCIVVDAHQLTGVEGVYAAGDVVIGLDQSSHAMGEGGVAATTIRNDLAKEKPLLR